MLNGERYTLTSFEMYSEGLSYNR